MSKILIITPFSMEEVAQSVANRIILKSLYDKDIRQNFYNRNPDIPCLLSEYNDNTQVFVLIPNGFIEVPWETIKNCIDNSDEIYVLPFSRREEEGEFYSIESIRDYMCKNERTWRFFTHADERGNYTLGDLNY